MKVNCIRQVGQIEDIEILGATLLSEEEAKLLPTEMLAAGYCWWLSSQGYEPAYACCIYGDGYIYHYCTIDNSAGVRPVLKINLNSSSLKIGDKILFGDYCFTIISDKSALCDKIIGTCVFRKDWDAENANDYEKSDIKRLVDAWYNSAKKMINDY